MDLLERMVGNETVASNEAGCKCQVRQVIREGECSEGINGRCR